MKRVTRTDVERIMGCAFEEIATTEVPPARPLRCDICGETIDPTERHWQRVATGDGAGRWAWHSTCGGANAPVGRS
jgi:hypothetical protein